MRAHQFVSSIVLDSSFAFPRIPNSSNLGFFMVSYAMTVLGNHMPVIEWNDPLFIPPSDDPRQMLIADVFNGEDFDYWKRMFLIALSSKNKVGFVSGKGYSACQ